MKRKFILFSTVFSFIFSFNILAQAPVFQLQNLENEWIQFEDVKGEKLTVIDFWATWCQPCVRSIPELNKISEELKSQGVNFVGISIDGPRNQSKISPFVKSMGIGYPILRDINGEAMSDLNVTSVPTLLIFDNNGELVYTHEGFRPGDENVIKEEISTHL